MTLSIDMTRHASAQVEIGSVSILRPFAWLAHGATDLVRCAPANLAHGLLMTLLGWMLLLMLGNHPYFVAAAVTGFLLAAPIMTTGICELSRRRMRGEALGFDASLEALNRHGLALFKFGVVLGLIVAVWFATSEVMLRTVFNVAAPSIAETYYSGFIDTANRAQIVSYIATGAALALVVLLMSVVSVPLIIDRQLRASEAIRASWRVVAANPLAMLVWAALIVSLTAIGFATLLFGMIVLIPLLGHATWHAYRDLVRR
jgi:uncharacterized membrane protein